MRISAVAASVLVGLASVANATEAEAMPRQSTAIAAQSLDSALRALASERGFHIVYLPEVVDSIRTQGAAGLLTRDEALTQLLSGTGLAFRYLDADTVTIARALSGATPVKDETLQPRAWSRTSHLLRLAQAQGAVQAGDGSGTGQGGTQLAELETVIVTATKRAEKIQDVPLSIAVVSAQEIDRRGLVSADDYLRGIPGVSQGSTITGSSVIIRGLETSPSFQNFSSGPTVATYFGETPTTNSGGLSSNGSVDIKLVDIERVEVLRGPQGTAFGDASLGGAVRTIPAAPKVDRLEAKVTAGYSVTSGYGSDNHMIQAVGNIPLVMDKLAIRAAAYQYNDSGYYRNTGASDTQFLADVAALDPTAVAFARDVSEIGASEFTGGRLAALWQASDQLKFTLSYLTQKTEVDGLALNNVGSDPYAQSGLQLPPEHTVRGQLNGISDTDIDLANAVLEYDLGWANLLGTYSYVKSGSDLTRPYSLFRGTIFYATTMSQHATSTHREHVGELRLATKLDGPWNFIAGLYAGKMEDTTAFPFVWSGDPDTNPFGGGRYPGGQRDYVDVRDLKQQAVFAEVSWEFLPGLTLTGGGRAYKYDRTVNVETGGTVYGDQVTRDTTDETDSTFRANLSYKPNDDAMVYATWGEGFRLGKPQPGLPPGVCDLNGDGLIDGATGSIASTKSVDSDTVESTELGGKFTLLDRRVMLSAAVFRVEWTGMPFLTSAPSPPDGCALNYVTNAGAARSEGIETQINFQVTGGLSIDVGGSYTNAELTEDVPAHSLSAGTRLPGSPEWNANLALQYAFELSGYKTFVRADSIYVGTFSGEMPYSRAAESGGYVKLDLSAGVAIGSFNIDVFVRNLTDADDFTFNDGNWAYALRPRTTGLQLGYNF